MTTRADERRINQVIDTLVAGDAQGAVDELCRLIHRTPVPELAKPGQKRRRVLKAEPKPTGRGVCPPMGPQTADNHRARMVDPYAIRHYRETHPTCELIGCDRPSVVHHIIERSEVHIDRAFNLLGLCDGADGGHHRGPDGWHTLGPDGFLAQHADALDVQTRRKIHAALAYAKTLKRGDRQQA